MHRNNNDSRFLKAGHYAALKFESGWWFIQVVGREYVEVKPFVLQNENEQRAIIAAGTEAVTTDEIDDSQDRTVIEPDSSERNLVYQIKYGIAPSRMQTFTLHGRDRNLSAQDYDAPGEPGAYTNGFDSPYNDPTEEAELFYINSMAPVRIQAFNPMDEPFEARLSFHINKLRYQTITDKGLMKAILQGQQPAKLHMMGGGAQNQDQVGIPPWLNEAFSEHIHTTDEILSADNTGRSNTPSLPVNAEGVNGGN